MRPEGKCNADASYTLHKTQSAVSDLDIRLLNNYA